MGDWIRKIFSDSVSFSGKQKGEGASSSRGSDGPKGKRTMIVPRSGIDEISDPEDRNKRSMDLVVSLTGLREIPSLIGLLSKELPKILPFDFGTLRWNPLDTQNEEWPGEIEDDFPESMDFLANGGILSEEGSIEVFSQPGFLWKGGSWSRQLRGFGSLSWRIQRSHLHIIF